MQQKRMLKEQQDKERVEKNIQKELEKQQKLQAALEQSKQKETMLRDKKRSWESSNHTNDAESSPSPAKKVMTNVHTSA